MHRIIHGVEQCLQRERPRQDRSHSSVSRHLGRIFHMPIQHHRRRWSFAGVEERQTPVRWESQADDERVDIALVQDGQRLVEIARLVDVVARSPENAAKP